MATKLAEVLQKKDGEILSKWLQQQSASGRKGSAAEQQEATGKSRVFMTAPKAAVAKGSVDDISGQEWAPVKE